MDKLDHDQITEKFLPYFQSGKLGILCGAGISICSGIPDALNITKVMLKKLNCEDDDIAEYLSIKSGKDKGTLPVAFESIIGTFAENVIFKNSEKSYLEVFASKFHAAPNHNHYFWGKLLENGKLRFISTTNFDVCLEKAIGIKPLSKQVLCPYPFVHGNVKTKNINNTLIKLHGCMTSPKDMGTTIDQITKKDSITNIDFLVEKIFKKGVHDTLLIIGYSCSDGMDIIPKVQSIGKQLDEKDKVNIIYWDYKWNAPYFTWEDLSEAKTTPENQKAQNAFRDYKNVVQISGDLDDFIENFTGKPRITHSNTFSIDMEISNSLSTLGVLFQEAGRYEKAIEYLNKSLDTNMADPMTPKIKLARTYRDLGKAYNFNANYNESLRCHQKALSIQEKLLYEIHPEIAETNLFLGECYRDKGEFDKAIRLYNKALKIYLENFSETHHMVAEIHNNLSDVYGHKEEFEFAIEHANKSLEIRLKLFGEINHQVSNTFNNLGYAYSGKGDLEKASQYYQKSLEIRLVIYGENHDWVAQSNNNLGSIYYKRKDYAQALIHYQKSLEICLNTLGKNHFMVATLYNNLGNAYNKLKDFDNAIKYLNKALTLWIDIFGVEHHYIANTYNNLGNALKEKKDFNQAFDYYKKALWVAKKTISEENSLYQLIQTNIEEMTEETEGQNKNTVL